MADFVKLGGNKSEGGLEVHVEGYEKVFYIPLLNDLTLDDADVITNVMLLPENQQSIAYTRAFRELFSKYLPKEALGSLTVRELAQLVQAWQEASDGDVTLGE